MWWTRGWGGLGIVALALACVPREETASAEGAGDETSSRGDDDSTAATPTASSTGAATSSTSTSTTASDSSTSSDDDSSFIPIVDMGPYSACPQPEPTAQAASCDSGTHDAGELCWQGAATRCAEGGPEGVWFADFGEGIDVVYIPLGSDGIYRVDATIAGMLGEPEALLGGSYPMGLVPADVVGDLAIDLVVADEAGVTVHRGLPDVTFVESAISAIGAIGRVHTAELDGIAPRDLLGTTEIGYGSGNVRVAFGGPGGTYDDELELALGSQVWPRAADFDGDGRDELVVLTDDTYADPPAPRRIVVLSAPFDVADAIVIDTADDLGFPVFGRFDAGPTLDLGYYRDDELVMHPGLGDGAFAAPITSPIESWPVIGADLDGDGHHEVVTARSVVALTDDGTVAEVAEFDIGYNNYGVLSAALADANDDGLLDILFGSGYGQRNGTIHLVLSNP
ncbi:MAG TPA: VCBS repeat-containing protein [Nannocystaceae bacterium]|nr:VCBS repeat-containing protein [Nannocystaceae bacterium]